VKIDKKQLAAADEFNQVITAKARSKRYVHAETAISAAARMAGTFVLRSTGLPADRFEPGTPIFSDEVNTQGQQVLEQVDQALAELGVPFDPRKVNYDLPKKHDPLLSLMETQAVLDAPFQAIVHEFGLRDIEAAGSLAVAAAILVQKCAGFLDPHVAYGLIAYGMVEGSKTAPFREVRSPELLVIG
jgi:hypothetical protein